MKEIVIVIVNYYKEQELCRFAEDYILQQQFTSLRLYIVDNGSNNQEVLRNFTHRHPLVTLLQPGRNTGYFGAAHLAYSSFYDTMGRCPSVFIISNFDLSFDRLHFLEQVHAACESSSAAVLGPSVISESNSSNLNPMYRKRLTVSHLNRLILVTSFAPLYLVYQGLHKLKQQATSKTASGDERKSVYAIHGSFMIIRSSFFDEGGRLDYGSFLYGEEIFVAEQCRVLGLNIEFHPTLRVVHQEHSTTGTWKRGKQLRFLHKSLVYLRDKYFHGAS